MLSYGRGGRVCPEEAGGCTIIPGTATPTGEVGVGADFERGAAANDGGASGGGENPGGIDLKVGRAGGPPGVSS